MNYKLPITALFTIASIAANASIVAQWTFDDTAGTDLSGVTDSISGSLAFNSSTSNPANWETDGTGLLTGGGGAIGNADITNVSTGILQLDMTGVSFSALSGGTDDFVTIGLRSFTSSSITGFGSGSTSSNQALMVIGNENGSSGLDIEVIDNGTSILVNDLTTGFAGTFDFRIILDFDSDTADYLYQLNGGGYSTIVTQQINAVATIDAIALGGSTFDDTISIDTITLTAVPEPSTYGLLAGMLTLGLVLVRRRQC